MVKEFKLIPSKESSSFPSGGELLSFDDFIQQQQSGTMGCLLTNGDQPLVKDLFIKLWETLEEETIFHIRLDNTYLIQVVKTEKHNDYQSIFLNIVGDDLRSIKTIDLWRDFVFVLPDDYGVVDVDDFFFNYALYPPSPLDKVIFEMVIPPLTHFASGKWELTEA